MSVKYITATDMGGTFVDAVIWDNERKRHLIGKAPSTPEDPPRGIFDAIAAAAHRGGLSAQTVFSNTAIFLNGTTVTTNAMIEHKGSRTGLLITAGFEDTLEIARVMGRTIGLDETQLLDYRRAEPPPKVVPRMLVRGIVERIDASGQVICKLDVDQAVAAVDELVAAGIDALAISLLWSFRNPAHERALRELIEQRYPHLFVVASSELIPVLGEYERTNTTVINAFLGRVFSGYAQSLRTRIKQDGLASEPLIMQSVGGLAPARLIERRPVNTLFSGPVGGVIACQKLGQTIGKTNLITADMGGTSFDVGLVLDGQALHRQQTVIERHLVAIPTVEVVTIGAGGGSVAQVTDAGLLQVGPRSMGAYPGPACYQRGGAYPTVTDANVVLGFVNPEHFLGGEMKISSANSATAIEDHVGGKMGLDVIESAAAIHEIVNAHMADLIRRASVERGHDPRAFALVAFGGCGPVHGAVLGAEVGTECVIVPPGATAFSAMGISQSDIRHSLVRSFPQTLRGRNGAVNESALDDLNDVMASLSAMAIEYLQEADLVTGDAIIHYSAELRYSSQTHAILVPLQLQHTADAASLRQIVAAFERQYERDYGAGSSAPNARIEWVTLRSDIVVSTPHGSTPVDAGDLIASMPDDSCRMGVREMYCLKRKTLRPTPLYRADALRPGARIDGPALIISYGFTIPIHEGHAADVDRFGNFVIRVN